MLATSVPDEEPIWQIELVFLPSREAGEPTASLRDGRPTQPWSKLGRAAAVCVNVAGGGDCALSLFDVLPMLRFNYELASVELRADGQRAFEGH